MFKYIAVIVCYDLKKSSRISSIFVAADYLSFVGDNALFSGIENSVIY